MKTWKKNKNKRIIYKLSKQFFFYSVDRFIPLRSQRPSLNRRLLWTRPSRLRRSRPHGFLCPPLRPSLPPCRPPLPPPSSVTGSAQTCYRVPQADVYT